MACRPWPHFPALPCDGAGGAVAGAEDGWRPRGRRRAGWSDSLPRSGGTAPSPTRGAGQVRAGLACEGGSQPPPRGPGSRGAEVTHGAVDPQGEQHDEENHGPDGGQRERGERLGVDGEYQPGPWKQPPVV